MRLGVLASHPIQYLAPWFRGLAKEVDLEGFFAHRQSAAEQGKAGFGVAFDWDVDLLSGYNHRFLINVSARPGVNNFFGCDTPEIADIISGTTGQRTTDNGTTKHGMEVSGQWSVVSGQSAKRFDAFIVCGWHLKSYWQAVRACRRAGVPILVRGDSQLGTPRSWLKRSVKAIAYRLLLRQFAGYLPVGRRNAEYLAHYGVPEGKIFFAPHFVNNEWFGGKAEIARKQKAEIRRQWGVTDEDNGTTGPQDCRRTLVVLFVGKFIPKKRPQDLLQAMAKLRGELTLRADPKVGRVTPCAPSGTPIQPIGAHGVTRPTGMNVLAVFVGAGELENELRELAARENLRVHFTGFKNQSELPRYYAAAEVLVLPSESETWGLVVNEAMACGLPAIVSVAVGCAPDLIEGGRTGFAFPVADVTALAGRLMALGEMKLAGYDFTPALEEKMRAYSLEEAVKGTVEAVRKLVTTKDER